MVMKKEELSKLPVSTKQQRIAEIARRKRGEPLTLLNHYIDEKWLCVAYAHLRKESAPGVDGQTVLEYGEKLESNVKSLLRRAKTGTYERTERQQYADQRYPNQVVRTRRNIAHWAFRRRKTKCYRKRY